MLFDLVAAFWLLGCYDRGNMMEVWTVHPIAIKGGTVIDGTGTEPLRDGVVLVRDGRIAAIGKPGEVEIPSDAEVIDASGKTVMPGMIDSHMHLSGTYRAVRLLRQTLEAGFTTIGHVGGLSGSGVVALRDAIECGDLRGCSRLVAGAVVAPTAGHVRGRTADGPWEVRKAVREMVAARVDFIKTSASGGFWAPHEECWWRDYTFEELAALTDEAHSVGMRVGVHAHSQPGLDNSIRAGIDIIYHGAFIDDAAIDGIAGKGLYYIPTLRVTTERNIRVKVEANRPWEARKIKEAHPIHREGVRKAHERGVKIGVGTDLPGTPPWRAGDNAVELVELVKCGLSPMEAIEAATRVTAEALGIDDEIGTVESGKKADIIVVDGDPLDDITVLTEIDRIVVVIKDGVKEKGA